MLQQALPIMKAKAMSNKWYLIVKITRPTFGTKVHNKCLQVNAVCGVVEISSHMQLYFPSYKYYVINYFDYVIHRFCSNYIDINALICNVLPTKFKTGLGQW